MKDSTLFAYLSAVSAIISISDFLVRTIKNSSITISWISIAAIIAFVIFITLYIILKDKRTVYNIVKWFSYYFRGGESYLILEKECVYTFLSRTEMQHTKKHVIVSKVNNLNRFCDKFKWSKEQKLSEIKIRSNVPQHKVSVKRIENWYQYTVEFRETGKGQQQTISITIDGLHDPNKESLLFLSSNVVCRTKVLKLVVELKDNTLIPENIMYKVYDNYACEFPIIQEPLQFNAIDRTISKAEPKPVYGYRYVISWNFTND